MDLEKMLETYANGTPFVVRAIRDNDMVWFRVQKLNQNSEIIPDMQAVFGEIVYDDSISLKYLNAGKKIIQRLNEYPRIGSAVFKLLGIKREELGV